MNHKGKELKEYAEHRSHFIERLNERYGIAITEDDYEQLIANMHHSFLGRFSKASSKTIGILTIGVHRVWVLYRRDIKAFSTCYPKILDTDDYELITSCFSRAVRPLAVIVYDWVNSLLNAEQPEFKTEKHAAIHYYSTHPFPKLMILKYKGKGVDRFAVLRTVRQIVSGEHWRVGMAPVLKDISPIVTLKSGKIVDFSKIVL